MAAPQQEANPVVSSIAAMRQTRLDAVRACDAKRLAAMVTADVVVVHDNGRCARGREELRQDFLKGFETFPIEQSVSNPRSRRPRHVGL